jgi:hypothetical protein
MRPIDDTTDTRQREFDSLPLSDFSFNALFQAPQIASKSSDESSDQE